jgi:hypothetical protein
MIAPFADTYCWSLLPNHFHFLIKIKPFKTVQSFLQAKPEPECTATEIKFIANQITLNGLMEQAFKRFFQSYALSFNEMHNRKGNLFYRPFKRIRIEKDAQLTMTMVYIHANVQKHGLRKDFTQYQWSSWQSILSEKPTLLARAEVIDWFGNVAACIKAHAEMTKYYYDCEIAIED